MKTPNYWLIRMNVFRYTALIALLTLVQSVQAQEVAVSGPTAKTEVNTVAAQLSAPTNYSLLQPISQRPAAVTSLLQPKASPLVPLAPQSSPTENEREADNSSQSIEVTPVSFKSGEFDQHSFRVHNPTSRNLRQAKVLLKAPSGSRVQQVIPKPDSVDGASIIFTVGNLGPDEVSTVDVVIDYPHNELAQFESIVLSEEFGAPTSKSTTSLSQVTSPRPAGVSIDQDTSTMLKPKVPVMQVSSTSSYQVEQSDYKSMVNKNAERLAKVPNTETTSDDDSVEEVAFPSLDGFSGVGSSLHGPSNVEVGDEVEFSIEVKNNASVTAGTIVVQLSIPKRMKVTVLDRAAWYDGENRKISWELSGLEPGSTETIRYKAKIKSAGQINQDVVIGMDNRVESACSLSSAAR